MVDNARRRRTTWPVRAAASAAGAALLVGGCGAGGDKAAGPSPSASGRSARPSTSGSPSAPASTAASGGDTAKATPFKADPAKLPRTGARAEALAQAVALQPQDWGSGFRAQRPAASAPGTVAVLDAECRWQRRPLPGSVLASSSRYSELPGTGGKGTLKVTAAVTVHTTVRAADEQLATTLEEALRCRDQQVRTDERISGLASVAMPYGQGGNTYADDSVLEIGSYLTGTTPQSYRWSVARLGSVTVAVSVMGAQGYQESELTRRASYALTTMLSRIESELGGKN
ncbi:hypothetical protein KMT30_43220 [Streptomyces sp. IBSBF 2953]|uniref:hypothetical protein n=1 Tax=Streptomyces hayashii TaxID=2839966 RepID=UPI00211A1C76|nr:hypothetical protein [Streptomyces hayashii]